MPDVDPYDAIVAAASPRPRTGNYDDLIERHARANQIDPNLIRAVMGQESGGNRIARSPKGATGLMQLMPATAARFGVRNITDPDQNIAGGAKYLKFLSDRYKGDTDKILAGYNAGEGAVDKFGGIPPYKETQQYVPAVKARYRRLTGQLPSQTPTMQQPDPYDAIVNAAGGEPPAPARPPRIQPKGWGTGTIGQGVKTARIAPRGIQAASVQGEAQPSEATATRGALRNIAASAGLPTGIPTEAGDYLNELVAKGTAGLMRQGAGLARIIPHDPLAGNQQVTDVAANRINEGANQIARGTQAIDTDAKRGMISQTAQDVGAGAISSAPALILSRLGVPAPVAFGLQSYLEAEGRDADLKDILKETGIGAATGGLYEIPLLAKLGLLKQIGAKLGIGAVGGYGIAKAAGMPEDEARKNAALTALFMATGARGKEPSALSRGLDREIAREATVRANERLPETQTSRGSTPEGEVIAPPLPMRERSGIIENREGGTAPIQQGEVGPTISEQPRHVDLQRRLDDGTFGKETKAEAEARKAQVESATPATPEPALRGSNTPSPETAIPPAEPLPPEAAQPARATAETTAPTTGTKVSKLALGVEAKAVEANLTKSFEGLPEYQTINVTDQAQRATDLLQSDPERARNIAMGQGAQPPSGLLPESVFIAVENHALANGDVDTLRALATQSTRSRQATRMGQRIRMLGERNPDSPVAAIQQVENARSAGVTKERLIQTQDRVTSEVKAEMKRSAPKAKDWSAFLDSIRC